MTANRAAAVARAEARGLVLSGEQAAALGHITDGRDIGVVVGHAGTGKSAMLGVAREAWEAAGYEVRGVALSGIAAENLEAGSGIPSRTIASLEHGWGQGRDLLTTGDILVIDEAGMVGTRQLERVLSHAADAGAKVVLVGDPMQLQSIEAGAAFRSIHERHGGVEIGEVRRQHEEWQRAATRDLATGPTRDAIHAYDRHGMVHEARTREQARGDLIDQWDRDRQASPDKSRIILTHTNDEVRSLNEAARERMRQAGDLGHEVQVTVERGERNFASGDRVMFLQNERGLGVKNGTLGTIEQVSPQSLTVRTDDGRNVSFDLKDYSNIDHGYAATIHKAQGMTVDRTHVLATPGMDAHASYVALSRHRDRMELHYGRDDFANPDRLVRTLSRDRSKDMATDYEQIDPARDYAERRGITFRERVAEIVRTIVPEKVRGMFDRSRSPSDAPGLDGGHGMGREAPERDRSAPQAERRVAETREREVVGDPEAALRRARTQALVRHARAVDAIFEVQDIGGKASPEQVKELQQARKAFEELRPHGSHDAEAAYKKYPDLAREAASGKNLGRVIRALQFETEIRINPRPPRRPLRGALAEARPDQPAPVSGGRHVQLQGHALDDGRHGARPGTRSADGIDPRQPQDRDSASPSKQAAGLALNSPLPTASTSAEAGASESDPSDLPPFERYSTAMCKMPLRACKTLSCLVSEAVSNSEQEAAWPCETQTVSFA